MLEDMEYGVAMDARLRESARGLFLLLLLAVPEAYRGVKDDCRRLLSPLGVRGGLKIDL